MTAIMSNRLASVAVAALLCLPTAALAQSSHAPASAGPEGARPAAAQSSPLGGHPVAGRNAKERVEQRIKELHSQLRITPAERLQWDQFAQVMRDNARDMDQAWLQRADQFHSMNAVQNMESYAQNLGAACTACAKARSCFPNAVRRDARRAEAARGQGLPGEC